MLRNFVTISLLAFAGSASLFSQNVAQNPAQDAAQNSAQNPAQTISEPAKQTARQALIEMFLGKGPDDFVKHLPEDTRRTLIHKGDTPEASWVLRLAQLGREIGAQGQHVQTFDDGPTIVVVDEGSGQEKLEVLVEHDSFMGESDEIELSIKYSKNGQQTTLPFVPRFIFTLQQEKEIWRLTEVTAAAHMPLTDPDYLKGLRKLQNESNEGMIQMRVNMIVGAEKAYATQHPDQGFTCELSKVFQERQAAAAKIMAQQGLQDSTAEQQDSATDGNAFGGNQANEAWNGYHFTLSGCDGSPASHYVVSAAPTDPDPDTDTKTFCADESGVIKYATGGKPSSCLSNGQPLNAPTPPAPAEE